MRSHVVHQSRTSSRKIDLASGSVLQLAEVASFLRPVPSRPIRSLGADRKLPTSKRDQIAIHRLLSSTMAPRGTPATSSSTPAPSDTHPPGNTPDGGDTGGEDRDVASASPPPRPSQSEHSEEEEDEPGQGDLEEEVDDEDGPDDNGPSKDPEDPLAAKPRKTPVTSFLSLERASTLQSQGDLPSGRAVDFSGQVVAPAVYEVPPEFLSSVRVRLVGIPATERHNDGKTYTQNGYGGLDALVQMESLGTGDLARLYDFFGEDDDIHDFLLAPRVSPLPADELEPVLNGIGVRREMASILTEFGSENLAQRVFGTVSVL
jgi:hypothetical protein